MDTKQKFPFKRDATIETLPKSWGAGGPGASDPFVSHFTLENSGIGE